MRRRSLFAEINSIFDVGRSHYNSLQIKAETKSARYGIYGLISYTYSRSYDTGYSDGLGSIIGATYFPLPNWQNLDWGLSQINLNQNFTASIIYDLPFGKGRKWGSNWNAVGNAILGGWEATVIEHATSGFPIFDIDSANSGVSLLNANGSTLIRPNMTCNPTLSHPTLSEWFNTACFSQPAAGELGNAPRTLPVAGPDFVNTDFSIIKHFVPREGWRVDFRTEFFNLFNHRNSALPATSDPARTSTPRSSRRSTTRSTIRAWCSSLSSWPSSPDAIDWTNDCGSRLRCCWQALLPGASRDARSSSTKIVRVPAAATCRRWLCWFSPHR